ncbi:hypothetical protein [Mucilaginibacter sp.]|uniref:hypothetical protein n=1 Tax=Mucilaginibacter sp. TaxID=1882438 RepID=UPI0025DC5985|nr:hypothetical protein [Mucilaginibacter sp.]
MDEQTKKEYKRLLNIVYSAIERCNNDIPLIKNSISKAHKKWPENAEGYFVGNIPLRLRLSVVDMSTLFITVLGSDSESVRNLTSRLVCGQLYEFLEDVPKMFGKRYRKQHSHAPKWMKLDEQISTMMRSFNETKTKYHTYLKEIRNNVASHRDDDGMKQADIIDSIDPIYIASIFVKITGWYFTDYLPYELRVINMAEKLGFGPELNR